MNQLNLLHQSVRCYTQVSALVKCPGISSDDTTVPYKFPSDRLCRRPLLVTISQRVVGHRNYE